MKFLTLLLTTLLTTSLAAPTNPDRAALIPRNPNPSPNTILPPKRDSQPAADPQSRAQAVQLVRNGLVTDLLDYQGGEGILGSVVDALIKLLQSLSLRKRALQLSQKEVNAVKLETLKAVRAKHEGGATWKEALLSILIG